MTNVTRPTENLISGWSVEEIRKAVRTKPSRRPDTWDCACVEYGSIEFVLGTGRAVCRSCGEKIAKDEPALRFPWDFSSCGSYTSYIVHVHFAPCAHAGHYNHAGRR